MKSCIENNRPANPRYEKIVTDICYVFNIEDIPVVASDHPNACATISTNGRVIGYNPSFLDTIEKINPWAVVALFSHEVAHHFYDDVKSAPLNSQHSHYRELSADQFAGFACRRLNVPLADALELFSHPAFIPSDSHPDRARRKRSFVEGWEKAYGSFIELTPKENSWTFFEKAFVFITITTLFFGGIALIRNSQSNEK